MLVRRWVARGLMVVLAGLLGAITLGAAPAYADEVGVSAASTFTAGKGPQNVDLRLRREDDGCIRARAQLRIRMDGLSADQVVVGVSSGGRAVQVQLNAQGGGDFITQLVQPARAEMCENRNRQQTVRFQVAFGPNAPNGEVRFVGTMLDEQGTPLAEEDDGAQVRGGASPTPSRTPEKTKSPTPSPTPEEEETEEPVVAETSFASPAPDPTQLSLAANDGPFGGLGVPIAIGVTMVGIGAALIVLLVRRNRDGGEGAVAPAGGGPWADGGGGTSVYGGGGSGGGGWSGGASATQMLPTQPPGGPAPRLDFPTQSYPGMPSGPNAHRARNTPPDPTTKLPRVTE